MIDAELAKNLLLYVPLSVIGLWRWSFWLIRRFCATLYKPNVKPWPANEPKPTVSIVTPVYNEDPELFEEAMQSWIRNDVDEIVAVIDATNTRHIVDFERRYANNSALKNSKTKFRLFVTPKSGKRAALCDGLEVATGDLIAAVDSDTIWDDDVVEKTLPYFRDPQIGGATLTQRIKNPHNVANVMFDMLLYTRYKEEVPFLLGVGKAFNTLSGRTGFYRREALFNDQYDNMHLLRHEFFMGARNISGDDKRLTHLIVQQGWHTAFVLGPSVYTTGMNSIRQFLKQRLRWTRNSWRADLRAVGQGWVWSHPALAIFMIDRFIMPLFMLFGPVVMTFAIIRQEWIFAGVLLVWWLLSRFIRVFGYFKTYPKRIIYLPAYIIYGYVNAIIKVYAFATLIENSWATRWSKTRAKRKGYLRKGFTLASGYAAIALFMIFIVQIITSLRAQAGADIQTPPPIDNIGFQNSVDRVSTKQQNPPTPVSYVDPTMLKTYVLQPGDNMNALSQRFGISVADLRRLNNIPDADEVSAGAVFLYYDVNAINTSGASANTTNPASPVSANGTNERAAGN